MIRAAIAAGLIVRMVCCAPTTWGEPFEPTVESLERYQCAEWFRDAKFGIYVHWGVYSVPERGEWYARMMYEEDGPVYKHHVRNWGHPSQFGYHDFIPMWRAEKFDADKWLTLFKQAGARYFTPCAMHHDGFYLGRTKLNRFNAVDMGPQRDLLGEMREATLNHGLRFGVTTHSDRAISWMQPAHGADTRGPLAGVPYITNDPKYHDLYLLKYYDGNRADTEDAPTFWKQYWLLRMKEMIDTYRPDFVYLDSAVPFAGSDRGRTGMELFAYYYNANMSWHAGRLEGVLTHKGDKGPKRAPYFPDIATLDIERGVSGSIRDQPWQTDDSIGPWGYNSAEPYKDANAVIDKMIDTVSKNGNYLLNVPPKADGSFDEESVAILNRVGQWFDVHGEAIYGTRPWLAFGEGPDTRMSSRAHRSPYTAANIRFTQSKDGSTIYAIQLAAPAENQAVVLESFAVEGPGAGVRVTGVSLVGSSEAVDWAREEKGLHITPPAEVPDELAVVYRIETR